MKKLGKLLLCLLSVVFISACTDEYEDVDDTRIPVTNTTIMFFPWSNNLKPCFIQNIRDFKSVVQQNGLNDERFIVCIESEPGVVDVIEIKNVDGVCTLDTLATYTDPGFTTSDGIAGMLDRVYSLAPAKRYSMTVGCHGTGWVPANSVSTRGVMPVSDEMPLTRYFGGQTSQYQIEISAFKEGVLKSHINKFETLLFDVCYMSTIEVAYELQDIAKYIIAYPTEVMAYGFPYQLSGKFLIGGGVDYENVCESFYRFYLGYEDHPCGTISVINCYGLDSLAKVMKKINMSVDPSDSVDVKVLQRLDGYDPILFVDFQDYVHHLTNDAALVKEFDNQLSIVVPYKRNTVYYFSASAGRVLLNKCCGLSTSEPSSHTAMSAYKETRWYQATH